MSKAKQQVATAALDYVKPDTILGVGSGSTVNCFIAALAAAKVPLEGTVAASEESATLLRQAGYEVLDLNNAGQLALYIDGADEINGHLQMIKGGGAALTREKIVASAAREFICIADSSKQVEVLGKFPLPIEVIPMARSTVARQLVKLGGSPEYRQGIVTDNGNVILDVYHLKITDPVGLEAELNNIPGIVTNGIFARRPADKALIAADAEVKVLVG